MKTLKPKEVDWRKNAARTDFDADDTLLRPTPPDVVAVLGFDPLEFSTEKDENIQASQPEYFFADIIKSRNSETPDEFKKHDEARNAAQIIYERTAIAAAQRIEKEKKTKKREEEILLLFLMAGEDAYEKTYQVMGTEELKNADQTQISEQAKTFAAERQPLLEGYAKKLSARVQAATENTTAEGMKGEQVLREIKEVAQKVSTVMAETEAQATYGAVQIDRLARAGFKTKIWATCEDEKVRQSHVDCGNQGAIKLGEKFINGLKYPGDPAGKPEDVCNCRCWLIGGSR